VKFIDEATITVQSGDGGRGCVSFRRERFVPRGGPDGGDGGKGGDVILKATSRKRTLYHLQFKKHYQAPGGDSGQGRHRTGRGGENLIIEVPLGTILTDVENGMPLGDLVEEDQELIIAKGGHGGLGNLHFKSSTHRSPRFAQPGEAGVLKTLKLELRLLADVGIIGLPNAGKSTLISAISAARPKIADYPFTTLTPTLGVVQVKGSEPFVVADIPGLIEGAHTGAGLGTRFLRHIERTSVLVHLIDAADLNPDDPLRPYEIVQHELMLHSSALAKKPTMVVLNKLDVDGASQKADQFCRALPEGNVIRISAAAGQGLENLKVRMLRYVTQPDDNL
jgi:GTPase